MQSLNEKTVVLIGAFGLLGRRFTEDLLKSGANVVAADLNIDIDHDFKDGLLKKYGTKRIVFCIADVTDNDSVKKLLDFSLKSFLTVDAVVNGAYPRNKDYGKDFFDVSYASFTQNLSWNLGGNFLVSKIFAEYFVKKNKGNIINISSIYGHIAPKFEIYKGTEMTTPVEYAAIKSGLNHLTKYLAKRLKGHNIRVNCISPGGLLNNQPDSFLKNYKSQCLNKGMLEPQDISGLLNFLISDSSQYINGQSILVDDGFTL